MNKELDDLFREVSGGIEQAYELCKKYTKLAHDIDDLVDGEMALKEIPHVVYNIILMITTDPFFKAYENQLNPILLQVLHTWDESTRLMRDSTNEEAKKIGDHLRLNGQEFLIAIARICNPYQKSQEIAVKLHLICWTTHHTKNGEPI